MFNFFFLQSLLQQLVFTKICQNEKISALLRRSGDNTIFAQGWLIKKKTGKNTFFCLLADLWPHTIHKYEVFFCMLYPSLCWSPPVSIFKVTSLPPLDVYVCLNFFFFNLFYLLYKSILREILLELNQALLTRAMDNTIFAQGWRNSVLIEKKRFSLTLVKFTWSPLNRKSRPPSSIMG